jgi:PadR family transcriptional regulator PadR
MISKPMVAASTKPLVLLILRSGENYGYAIIQTIRRISGGRLNWSEPMLYPLLQRMEKEGLLASSWQLTDRRRLRKYYRLTEKGLREQERENAQWVLVNGIFNKLLKSVSPSKG